MKPKHMTLGVAAIALMAGTAFAQDTTAPTLDSTAPETEMQSEPTTGMVPRIDCKSNFFDEALNITIFH